MNIFIVGPMGSGKSTVGKIISDELFMNFFDTDEEIETRNMSDIINKYLPAQYRMDYLKILNDVYVTKQRKEEIIFLVNEILEEHGYNEEG